MNTVSFPGFLGEIAAAPAFAGALEALRQENFPLELDGAEGAAAAALIALAWQAAPRTCLAVTATEQDAESLAGDLETAGVASWVFPWWGAAPYGNPPAPAVFAERCRALSSLVSGGADSAGIVIVPERAFLGPLPPPAYFKSLLIPLKPGDTLDTAALAETLVSYGYLRVPRVQVQGEFALRGEVLDLLMGGEPAYRILLDFDRIGAIRRFDPSDQSSLASGESGLVIRPLKEVVWTDERILALSRVLAGAEEFPRRGAAWLEELMERRTAPGEETLFPLAFEEGPSSFADYLIFMEEGGEGDGAGAAASPYAEAAEGVFRYPLSGGSRTRLSAGEPATPPSGGPMPPKPPARPGAGPVFFLDRERLEHAQEALGREYRNLYRRTLTAQDAPGREFPAPERLLLSFAELSSRMARRVSFMNIKGGGEEGALRTSLACEPPRSFFGNIDYLREEFTGLLGQGWRILVMAESEVQAGRIGELLYGALPQAAGSLSVLPLPLSAGFSLPEIRFMAVAESEIFGRRKRSPRSLRQVKSAALDSFVELNPGDFVVHVNYGIGLFKGIERVRALGNERDYIKLEYLGEEVVFVPIEQVNLVQRYIGNEGLPPRLDKLGSKSWENRKNRVSKSVEDIAQRLMALYSKRKASRGFPFPKDTEWQTMFEAAFPYEETEDQLRCVEEIKQDMESPHPMDRLICGDVGFGKTEVALRAAFKAIMGGKQAAFLAPTTILAEQHYENFMERFSRFPVTVAMLSRFVDKKTTRQVLEQLKSGAIDVLVGTHRIIQRDVVFKDLGLMVIDEEQRFGVKDKERLKELKTNVDCLTLSATPIPRTLHMSLLKIRDMSLLATPPRNRHPIETVIDEWNEERIAQAVRREVERGGQVFFLHNRIETLDDMRVRIERMAPEMLVETAHGQMDPEELEDVMHRFVHGGFHVLVSTTIIENGIDIPNVNTIIIDRADMYGVSQLYQLRGRVGRSDRVAYAYLFYPRDRSLSEIAMKRLQVISDFTELGSGFKIAIKDMEIRGAGNLLGREQSGDIYSVGFDLYLRLLDEAIRRLEDEHYEAENETLLELEYSGFIPSSYIDSAQEKMEVYKKIAAVKSREELDGLHGELLDRFGPPPDEAASLLALAEIRIICREISVVSLRERGGLVRVEFGKVARVSIDRLLRLMKESSGRVLLDPKAPNVLILKTGNIGLKEKSEFIREKLAALAAA
ncbi:MAG: transcription-repair coupling factor [Spirochaetaceae bacterium]|jgi:transcription-repair coupling factor (superfamily II helicase)|nr:transcription-repair coupling factor [Spirochaetaceae bacterium]